MLQFVLQSCLLLKYSIQFTIKSQKPTGVDRFLFFGDYDSDRTEPVYLEYRTRAVSRGVYTLSGCSAEAMYDPDLTGSIPGQGHFIVE